MEIIVQPGDLTKIACDILIVNLFEEVTQPAGATGAVDRALDGWISLLIEEQDFKGKLNSVLELPTFGKIPAKRVLVVGLGKQEAFDAEKIRQVAATAIKQAKSRKARTVATLVHGAGIAGLPVETCAQAVAEGSILGPYSFEKYKTVPKDEPPVQVERVLVIEQDAEKLEGVARGVSTGRIIAEATNFTRDMASEPPDVMTPGHLAGIAEASAAEFGLGCEVWELDRITQERMNCLMMVGRGSAHPPRFIRLDYQPEGTPKKRVCLIGKGLCYDSGGLSLKPSESMKHMKTDMAGAAAVIGAMRAVAQLKPNVAVTAMIPACENMIDGKSYKVDDVLRARNGKTIEIDNTDAEGRLVLADALSYAAEQNFDETIDIATLTGGCIIAFAHIWTAVMGNDQGLQERIIAAGKTTGERFWPMPFDQEVRDFLDSDMADIRNTAGREGSTIQGGMFLQEFAGKAPWAHLDIAGTSFLDKARVYEPKGSTGVPVRTLVAYLLS